MVVEMLRSTAGYLNKSKGTVNNYKKNSNIH